VKLMTHMYQAPRYGLPGRCVHLPKFLPGHKEAQGQVFSAIYALQMSFVKIRHVSVISEHENRREMQYNKRNEFPKSVLYTGGECVGGGGV